MTILTLNKEEKSKSLNMGNDLIKHYPPSVLSAAGTLPYSKNKRIAIVFIDILNCLKDNKK